MLGNYSLVEDLLKRKALLLAVNTEGNTALHLAFIFKHENIIDLLFEALKSVSNYENFKNKEGLTHLHFVSTRMDATIVKSYLEAEADVTDIVSEKSMMWAGYTALHFAAKYKSLSAVKVLLEYQAARDSKDCNGQTPLQLANENLVENSVIVNVLSRPETDSDETNLSETMTDFHTACLKNDPALVKSYIEKGVNVNLTISPEADFCPAYTPLHFAVESNCKDTVKLLLEYGADTGRVNNNGMTPIHLALYKENHRSTEQVLGTAIADILIMKVNDMLSNDRLDCNGLSYFHVACTRENSFDDVKKFLDGGRDVNECVSLGDHKFAGFTPLHFAVLYRREKIAELLINHGADLNAFDGEKRGTPLHVALEDCNNMLYDTLILEGADPTAVRPYGGKTATHLVVESLIYLYNHGKCMRRLCSGKINEFTTEYNVDIDAKDADGNTALHIMCLNMKNDRECLRQLLDNGASINVENHANRTPFEESMRLEAENRGKGCKYAILYHHVMNLKALGLEVSQKNVRSCEKLAMHCFYWYYYAGFDSEKEFDDEKLDKMEKQRLEEIEKMKKVKIDDKVSVYDFVLMDEKGGVAYVNSDLLKKFEELRGAKKEFPVFGYLIRLKYLKTLKYYKNSLKRSASSNVAEENSTKRQRS